MASDEVPMPAQQRPRGHESIVSVLLESSRDNAESTARSGKEGRGRATCRRKTATSCRNTRISAFLDACRRASSASQLMC